MSRVFLWLTLSLLAWSAGAADSTALFAATLNDLDGKPQALAQWRGKPLIVNFWARWCGPCKKEIPDLVALQAQHKDAVVIGIAIEDAQYASKIKDFASAYDINYPVLLGGDQGLALMRALGNEHAGLPFTLAVHRSGKVVASKTGLMTRQDMDTALSKALQP